MKIRVALIDKDVGYLRRVTGALSSKYTETLELYSFSDLNLGYNALRDTKFDVVLASDRFMVDAATLPSCGFAYLVDSSDISSVNDERAVGKYQRVDVLYNQILDLYADSGHKLEKRRGVSNTKLVLFSSPCGGVGTSTAAAAYALRLARNGKKPLYLNFEDFGGADAFFLTEKMFSLGDVIYAIKGQKANISLKLDSCVSKTQQGVYFYQPVQNALDMFDFPAEERLILLNKLLDMGSYDIIILDTRMDLAKPQWGIYEMADVIVLISSGTDVANHKIVRFLDAVSAVEQLSGSRITDKACLFYNMFSNKNCHTLENIALKKLGGSPRFEHAGTEMVVNALSNKSEFDQII